MGLTRLENLLRKAEFLHESSAYPLFAEVKEEDGVFTLIVEAHDRFEEKIPAFTGVSEEEVIQAFFSYLIKDKELRNKIRYLGRIGCKVAVIIPPYIYTPADIFRGNTNG